jgi:exopolyphosphatase/guanosine-5'-triphosphate,3'-diphosphate pyrophosphatase
MEPESLPRSIDDPALARGRVAIIDIGSNSIRLVVYDGPSRAPSVLFNEKVLAGLGRGLAKDGALDPAAIERALAALARFQTLVERMRPTSQRDVATAAVREASNGPDLLARLRAMGLDVELLSGDTEAKMAGQGVLAGIPDAEGIVGDLGGGSLELVRVGGGAVHERVSLPLGVLRLAAIQAKGTQALDRLVGRALTRAGWRGAGMPFYLVGGSWRALARFDMHLTSFPLPIVHHYRMPASEGEHLVRVLAGTDPKSLRAIAGLSAGRIASLPAAAGMLAILARQLDTRELIVSAYGLREGLLYHGLPAAVRAQDPLLTATRETGARLGRFHEHGDLLDRWIAPLFADESAADARLRRAACLLADIAWRVHPEFRAERGLDAALHGSWVGVDARGRAMMARALYTNFGGRGETPVVRTLCTPQEAARADRWGLAMRLGQRLSGGVVEALRATRLSREPDRVTLHLAASGTTLYGEAVERRHKTLAHAFGLKPARA